MQLRRWHTLLVTTVVAAGAVVAVATPAQASISKIQVREITGTWHVNAGATSTKTLTCASGEKVLQGGILSQTMSTGVYVLASYSSSSTTWFWAVYNDTFSSQEVHARAICATGVDGWSVKWGVGTVTGGTSKDIDSLNCPSGKTSVGGGWQVQMNTELGDWFVSASYPADNAWRVRVRSNSSPQVVNAQAICISQTVRSVSHIPTTVNPGATAVQYGDCDRWLLVGGGFKAREDSPHNFVTAAIPNAGLLPSWKINLRNTDTVPHTFAVVVVCVLE